MRVLFVVKSKKMQNLGVMYLSSIVKSLGHECKIVEFDNATREVMEYKPGAVGFSIMTGSQKDFHRLNEFIKNQDKNIITMAGGPHPTFFPKDENLIGMDYVCRGEGERFIHGLLNGVDEGFTYNKIDSIPWPDRTDFPDMRIQDFIASRGCVNKCVTGDTIIHTINGDFAIKDLSGKENIKVLSRNVSTREPEYVDAINIGLREEKAKIVRVHFDDGSHIDCTPDHKFKTFSYKNQYCDVEIERDIRAIDLKPKQQIRAVNFSCRKDGRMSISTHRKTRILRSRIIMESIIGRKLESNEFVHHIDKDKTNDCTDNLIIVKQEDHISIFHEEFSDRMKLNNPVYDIDKTILSERAKKTFTGRKQSVEERIKKRESKLGSKNPMWKDDCIHQNKQSRIKELQDVNHKVLIVEELEKKRRCLLHGNSVYPLVLRK